MKYWPSLLFLVWFLIVSVALIRIRPQLMHPLAQEPLSLPPWTSPRPLLTGAIFGEGLTAPTFTYREGIARDGVHQCDAAESFEPCRQNPSRVPLDLKIAWRTRALNVGIHGASKSSPAADASGIYVGGDNGWFYHFDLDGKLIWQIHFDHALRGVHGTAALDRDHAFIGAYNGRFYCIDKKSGAVVWVTQLVDAVGSSAVIDNDFIYVSSERAKVLDGYLFKLKRATGVLVWSTMNFGEQVHSSPALDLQTGSAIVGANNGFLFSFSLANGTLLWRQDLGGAIKGTALIKDGVAYVTTRKSELVAVETRTGSINWRISLQGLVQSSPTLVPDVDALVMGGHKVPKLYGVKIGPDASLLWEKTIENGQAFDVMGSGVSVRMVGSDKFALWIACGAQSICALDALSGQILNKIPLGGTLTGVPTVFDQNIYVALNDGGLVKLSARR